MEKKIKDWLSKGGFPLEMQFANALLTEGFNIDQSVYYRDSESNKFREIDIVANKSFKINDVTFFLTYVIECKSSKDKPWLVFANTSNSSYVNNRIAVHHTSNLSYFLSRIDDEEKFKSDILFTNKRDIGHSLQVAFNNSVDRAFEARQSTTKACEYFSKKMSKRIQTAAIYIPMIMIEGKLFDTIYENEGILLSETNWSEILVKRSFHEFGNAHIYVVSNGNLKETAAKMSQIIQDFVGNYTDKLNKHVRHSDL